MADFFTSIVFKFFLLPLGTVLLSVFVKTVSRNDRYSRFAKEDIAVGLEIALAAMIAFIAYSVAAAARLVAAPKPYSPEVTNVRDKFVASPWLIVFLVMGLWGVSTVVRKLGWKSRDELNWLCGIVLPFAYGLVTLVFVVAWIGG